HTRYGIRLAAPMETAACLAGLFGLRLQSAACDHESSVAERGCGSIPLGPSTQSVSAQLHSVFRGARMVPSGSLHEAVWSCARQHGIRAFTRVRKFQFVPLDSPLCVRTLCLLHGVPRRARKT